MYSKYDLRKDIETSFFFKFNSLKYRLQQEKSMKEQLLN